MAEYIFTVPYTLIGLNEYINECRRNKYVGANLKREIEHDLFYIIKKEFRSLKIYKPVIIEYLWVEKDKRRDKDNIAFAQKFVQDALVMAGILKNDGWNEIKGFTHDFAVDKKNPRVEIRIVEV